MQVERSLRGEWLKGEEYNRMYPKVEDSFWKRKVILYVLYGGKVYRLGSGDYPIR